ncbi:MAG: nucleotidyltransferase family protein [Clostridia bacterium]|nr:nucleotidyltransferase family protein [Clostridia bacterium]MBQ9801596.1 nucleotidyltransferase family protein [Clostridia bacterium]
MELYPIFFATLRAAITGEPQALLQQLTLDEQAGQALYRLANKHDLAHLTAQGLELHGIALPEETAAAFRKQKMMAVFRAEQLNCELEALSEALEDAKIPFIPLKGAVLRELYPEHWMRTSCDIDVLIHERDLARATLCLTERLSYQQGSTHAYDVPLVSPTGVHIELHFRLASEHTDTPYAALLDRAFTYAAPVAGATYRHAFCDDFFYFYHIAHIAKHVVNGGCGVRPLLDLLVLRGQADRDPVAREALLREGGLSRFAALAEQLADMWFCGGEETPILEQLAHYVLSGGVYGSTKNRVAVQQSKRGGRIRYLLSRVFLPYHELKVIYPVLRRHKWLFPFMQLRRWWMRLFGRGRGFSRTVLRRSGELSREQMQETSALLAQIGL